MLSIPFWGRYIRSSEKFGNPFFQTTFFQSQICPLNQRRK
ncbi:hypothetical protein HMPREF3156_01980 [Neisseria sp. HMSC06F02]|nr:hypothetical protein HMPREF3156_01980 [Neisseria sp. HMSC06F02]